MDRKKHKEITKSALYLDELLKVENSYLVTCLIRTPIFQWCVVYYGSKNGYQKDMCLKEIGLCVQNMIMIILGST